MDFLTAYNWQSPYNWELKLMWLFSAFSIKFSPLSDPEDQSNQEPGFPFQGHRLGLPFPPASTSVIV